MELVNNSETKIAVSPPPRNEIVSNREKQEQEEEEVWDCLCLHCDKELVLHLTRVLISSSVLAFCMLQLANGNGDNAFYSSTLSLILGAFLGASNSNSMTNHNKSKND